MFVIILFVVWILPLGAFVDVPKQKEFCGGKRAICMCAKMLAKQMEKYLPQGILQTAKTNSQDSSGPSASKYFSLYQSMANAQSDSLETVLISQLKQIIKYSQPIEHVPKSINI